MRYNHKGIITASLVIAAFWCFLLYVTDYPPESWAGVAAVGYIMMFGMGNIVSRINALAIRKTNAYTVATFGERDPDETTSDGEKWVVEIVGTTFVLAVGYISGGLAIMLTSLIIQAVGLPAISASMLKWNLAFAGVSLCLIVGLHALVYLAIYRARRRRGQQIRPITLTRQYLRIGLRKVDRLFSVARVPSSESQTV